MKTTYDEIVKQPCDKLAQTMQDMTYCYNETVVPKKHYKKLLTKQLEEVVADSVAVNMVNAYYKTLAKFNKGNREWFVLAILCIELGVKPDKASAQELSTLQMITSNVTGNQAPLYSIQTSRMPLKVLSRLKECKHSLVRLCFFCYNENTNREYPRKSTPLAEPLKTAGIEFQSKDR